MLCFYALLILMDYERKNLYFILFFLPFQAFHHQETSPMPLYEVFKLSNCLLKDWNFCFEWKIDWFGFINSLHCFLIFTICCHFQKLSCYYEPLLSLLSVLSKRFNIRTFMIFLKSPWKHVFIFDWIDWICVINFYVKLW